MGVAQATATALALVVHELATNSVKYGALLAGDGVLDVSGGMADEDVEIVWTEQGGPDVPAPAGLTGYGSRLVRQTIEDQLISSVTYDWTNSGAVVTLRINGEKMSL